MRYYFYTDAESYEFDANSDAEAMKEVEKDIPTERQSADGGFAVLRNDDTGHTLIDTR